VNAPATTALPPPLCGMLIVGAVTAPAPAAYSETQVGFDW
jgi:hypothetical protein